MITVSPRDTESHVPPWSPPAPTRTQHHRLLGASWVHLREAAQNSLEALLFGTWVSVSSPPVTDQNLSSPLQ